ncbi:VTT domain-containing protein [Legionella wadsworthii]
MKFRMLYPVKTFLIVLSVLSLISFAFLFHNYSNEIIQWIDHLGWFAPVLFLIIYCFTTVMFLPTMVMTLAGGALFGPLFGTLLNLIGATCGAALSFLITRHLFYDRFSQKKEERLNKLISAVEQKGWMIVALLRLLPIIPFNIVNCGLGLTKIKFRIYLITTVIFLIPAEIVYTYFGYAGMEVLKQGAFYRSSEIIILVLIFLLLCLFKLLPLRFSFKRRNKKTID